VTASSFGASLSSRFTHGLAPGLNHGLVPGLTHRFPPGLSPGLPLAPPPAVRRRRSLHGPGRRSEAVPQGQPLAAIPLLFTAGLLLGAVLLAPEQPRHQEAICQRHNGVAACRVW
jgi:hypothetical protein